MDKTIKSGGYSGILKAPASKSYMQRAIAIALLAEGETRIDNPAINKDSIAILKMAQQLGAEITEGPDFFLIQGKRGLKQNHLSVGESGLGVRMFTPIAALYDTEIQLNGEGSLLTRPLGMLEDPLRLLGARIESKNGYLPLKVQGPLKGGNAEVDGSISSQVLTGLLIALAKAKQNSKIIVHDLKSIPYIDMTIEIMEAFGVKIQHNHYHTFHIQGNSQYIAQNYEIEGDWSGAAFHLVGGAIAGDIQIIGINTTSVQADRAIIKALRLAGAHIEIGQGKIRVSKKELKAFYFDATHCPDLFPPLVVLAAACKGISEIKGASRLIYKESNRALALQTEMGKLGIKIELDKDIMKVYGDEISGGFIHSHNDHRIAMAAAIAGLIASEEIKIIQAEATEKSYPEFFQDYHSLQIPTP